MMNNAQAATLADKIKALFEADLGTFQPADFVAVAKTLGFTIDVDPPTRRSPAEATYTPHQQKQDGDGFWALAPGASDISEGMVWMNKQEQ